MHMIELINVSKEYKKTGAQVLSNTTFNVEAGRFYAVMGSSGSGKTTLLNVIGGIDTFNSGEISIDNVRLSALSRNEMADFRLNNVGIVYQNYNLIECLTLRENILLPLHKVYLSFQGIEDPVCVNMTFKEFLRKCTEMDFELFWDEEIKLIDI